MSSLRAFKVKEGQHRHTEGPAGKHRDYVKGETIVTRIDLAKNFLNKFEEVPVPAGAVDPVKPAPAVPPASKPAPDAANGKPEGKPQDASTGADDKSEEGSTDPVRQDVTADYPKAKKAGFLVFQDVDGFYVADKDKPKKMANKKPLAADEIDQYVADLS